MQLRSRAWWLKSSGGSAFLARRGLAQKKTWCFDFEGTFLTNGFEQTAGQTATWYGICAGAILIAISMWTCKIKVQAKS